MQKQSSHFRTAGRVSVWIGHFENEHQLDEYLNVTDSFQNDFGIAIEDGDILETAVESASIPISNLVEGFSAYKSFGHYVCEAAGRSGIETATTLLVYYTLEFEPSKVKVNPNAPLHFLGSFGFSE